MKKALSVILWIMPLWSAVAGHYFYQWPGAAGGLALGVALLYAGVRAQLLPLVEKTRLNGANGRNWPLFVRVDPSADYYKAVLAQELWESLYKTLPWNAWRTRSKSGQRKMEIMGHEVEVQAAVVLYGVGEATYRRAEAKRMQAGYNGLFEGQDVEKQMAAHRNDARKWVKDNLDRLR